MVNEAIVTSLKNAVEHGESLQSAMQVMVASGYNIEEIKEASKFISQNQFSIEPKSDEELTMPSEKKGFFSNIMGKIKKAPKVFKKSKKNQLNQPPQNIPQPLNKNYPQPLTPTPQQLNKNPQSVPQQQSTQNPQPIPQTLTPNPQSIPRQQLHTPQPQQLPQQSHQFVQRKAPVISKPEPIAKELKKINPKKHSNVKEIILLILLLILIGILVFTILYRDSILAWFS